MSTVFPERGTEASKSLEGAVPWNLVGGEDRTVGEPYRDYLGVERAAALCSERILVGHPSELVALLAGYAPFVRDELGRLTCWYEVVSVAEARADRIAGSESAVSAERYSRHRLKSRDEDNVRCARDNCRSGHIHGSLT